MSEELKLAAQILLDKYDEMRGERAPAAEFEILRHALVSRPEAESEMPAELTNERIIEIADKTRTAESRDGDYILPISFARAIATELKVAGNAVRDNARDAARWRFREQFLASDGAIMSTASGCQLRRAGELVSKGRTEAEAIDAAIKASKQEGES